MKITMRERMGKTLDEMLSPDDHIVLRCVDCQTFLLPREIGLLKRRAKDQFNRWTWDVKGLCPVCHPHPELYKQLDHIEASTFDELNREQYDIASRMAKSGLVLPEGGLSVN